jgi:hypothetical protein
VARNKLPPVPGLEGLGFELEEKLQRFLGDSGHQPLQEKFDQVFPHSAPPKLATLNEEVAMSDSIKLDPLTDDSLNLDDAVGASSATAEDEGLVLDDFGSMEELTMGAEVDEPAASGEDGLSFSEDFTLSDETAPEDTMTGLRLGDDLDLGDDVLDKLKEIDAIMQKDATQARPLPVLGDEDLDEGLNFASLNESPAEELDVSQNSGSREDQGLEIVDDGEGLSFTSEAPVPAPAASVSQPAPAPAQAPGFAEASGHYNSELERLQATLNHLRADRSELVRKLDEVEEERIHHHRQLLNLRAELDDKKIENQLLRKRSTDEIQQLQTRTKLEEERRLLAEEKVKALQSELTGMQQKMKMEVRKVGGRERELEQQLELLKSDASTQIRHRDMKILELKRRLDSMEFEVENVSSLEKKAVGDRQELEGKLDKAIKTLRAAIGVLEQDDPRMASLEKLKNNLDV